MCNYVQSYANYVQNCARNRTSDAAQIRGQMLKSALLHLTSFSHKGPAAKLPREKLPPEAAPCVWLVKCPFFCLLVL
jgi:hypothetical protein